MPRRDPEDRLKGIATFVQAAEAGSFAVAARRLRQTRSAVGKTIARLEQRLGVRLFNRSTRRQSLTESGEAYYERCKRALAEIDEAEAALDESGRELAGRLRVTVPLMLGRHVVAPVLSGLAARHPRLDLDLSFTDRVVDLVEERFDLGVRQGRLADSSSLAARRLGRYDFVICAAPEYLRKLGTPHSVDDFRQHVGIVYAYRGPEVPWTATGPDGDLLELRIQRRFLMDDLNAIADAALAGLGLARLPRWLAAPYVRSGALEFVWDGPHVHEQDVYAIWPHARLQPMKTRAAIDALARAIPALLDGSAAPQA